MSFKVELKSLISESFTTALSVVMNKELNVVASYKLSITYKQFRAHRDLWSEHRMKLLNKYSEKNEDGSNKLAENGKEFELTKANRAKFDKEYQKLVGIEVDITPIELSDLEGLKIAPGILAELTDIIQTS